MFTYAGCVCARASEVCASEVCESDSESEVCALCVLLFFCDHFFLFSRLIYLFVRGVCVRIIRARGLCVHVDCVYAGRLCVCGLCVCV